MNEERNKQWELFLSTGLPEAYTYLKARERQNSPKEKRSGDQDRRS